MQPDQRTRVVVILDAFQKRYHTICFRRVKNVIREKYSPSSIKPVIDVAHRVLGQLARYLRQVACYFRKFAGGFG
ncbi:hypothetical protein [Puia dinghuensis]|uniref:hypothetical protein n=1 Tax=Puia dinghuensis TaxID=1792502 RepID=UPI00357177AF